MEYALHILILIGINSILAMSLNFLVGYTGMVALGHSAFYCIGAYVSALLALNCGLSPWLGLLAGSLIATIFGLAVAVPSVRVKGDYFALATFGLGVVVYSVTKNWTSLTRGPMGLSGIPPSSILGIELSTESSYLIVICLFVCITYLTIRHVVNSPYGRVLKAIREDEMFALAAGKNVSRSKIVVFMGGAFFAGVAGSLYAHYTGFISPSKFTVVESITILLMVVFGGMGSLVGSVVGAAMLVALPELLRFVGIPSSMAASLRQMIYGFLLIVIMIWRPQGLMGKHTFSVLSGDRGRRTEDRKEPGNNT